MLFSTLSEVLTHNQIPYIYIRLEINRQILMGKVAS